jgi:hypothetical protein
MCGGRLNTPKQRVQGKSFVPFEGYLIFRDCNVAHLWGFDGYFQVKMIGPEDQMELPGRYF